MPSTRSSARIASKSSDNLAADASSSPTNDNKRKADDASPAKGSAKKSKKAATPKKQKTIEQTMELENAGEEVKDGKEVESGEKGVKEAESGEKGEAKDVEMKEAGEEEKDGATKETNGQSPTIAEKQENGVEDPAKDEAGEEAAAVGESTGAQAEVSAEEQSKKDTTKENEKEKPSEAATKMVEEHINGDNTESKQDTTENKDTGAAVESNPIHEDKARGESIPSTILEKGIIYFFTRASVTTNSDTPHALNEIARSYLVLRPLPPSTSLGSGALPPTTNARLLALPKKVLPKSGRDRFMAFVEKASTSIESLKEDFMQGSDYTTKTTGVRHTPPVTPIGEGVYAITSTGNTGGGRTTSHLAYMLTLPEELGEVQQEMGLAKQGSYVLSVKNPEAGGPANASLSRKPDWPKEVQESFGSLRWMSLQEGVKHLEYANAQVLLVGEGHGELKGAVETSEEAKKEEGKETAEEELEKLEEEDEERVEGLKGDDAVFSDLKISHDEYPRLMTSW